MTIMNQVIARLLAQSAHAYSAAGDAKQHAARVALIESADALYDFALGLVTEPPAPNFNPGPATPDDCLVAALRLVAKYHPDVTVQRCRHPSVSDASIWIFRDGKQIGATSVLADGSWRTSRMSNGQPTSQTVTGTLAAALRAICA